MTYAEVKEKVLAEVPKECPICGGPLTLSQDLMHLTCDNPDCDGKMARKLEIAAKALGIDNIGPSVAKELIEYLGVTRIYQVFDLTESDFMKVPRYQQGMAQKLYQSIHVVTSVPFATFIRACQFKRVGDGTAGDIAGKYENLEEFLSSSGLDLAKRLGGMSDQVADQIWESVEYDIASVRELAKRVQIIYSEKVSGSNPTGEILTCVVTGPLGFGARPEFQKVFGDAYGVKWASSVTKNTDILVTNESSSTSKYKKALELQAAGGKVQIMTEEEFLKYIGAPGTTAEARQMANLMEYENLESFDGADVKL